MYTDNWYTTVKLAKWRFCGTMVPSKKFSREDLDVPFLKLSNGAMSGRRWLSRRLTWERPFTYSAKLGKIRTRILVLAVILQSDACKEAVLDRASFEHQGRKAPTHFTFTP